MGFKTKEAYYAYHKKWRDENKAHLAEWRKNNRAGNRGPWHRRDRYGLSADDFNALLESQRGVCAICEQAPDASVKRGTLHVDHDHVTGAIRGLLCHSCNTSLGHFRDSSALLRKAAMYLDGHAANRHTA